jgi:2-polyprenyl-6-methoxyphenol hydroxylase-like FAD-dependent oxidoreductase
MTNHQVVIAGGGPTGLVLAAELALAHVDVAVVERRASQDLENQRGLGMNARTIEILDQRGVAGRFLAEGKTFPTIGFGGTAFDISDLPTRHPYGLALAQAHTERILAGWVAELPVTFYRAREVTTFTADADRVEVALSDGTTLHAAYLCGCDGGRSRIRKQLGIEFAGHDASISYINAELEFSGTPAFGLNKDARGTYAMGPIDGGRVRAVLRDDEVREGTPTLEDVRAALLRLYRSDFGLARATWLSRFSDTTRQAVAYRQGRVLLAGDAAHVHSPMGGQGLNLGVQDAANLGWKLAQVVRGTSPEGLLDTYQAERHPVARHAMRTTMAQTALSRGDDRMDAVRESIAELLAMDEPRRRYAARLTHLDVRYDLGEGHPLLGRRMPDLDLVTADGPRRVFSFLHQARPLLLCLAGALDIAPWADRVRHVAATYDGAWELPVVGAVAAPAAVLVRPDGHVAWVGTGSDAGLREALTTWFGPQSS